MAPAPAGRVLRGTVRFPVERRSMEWNVLVRVRTPAMEKYADASDVKEDITAAVEGFTSMEVLSIEVAP